MFLIAFVCHLRFSYDYETSTLALSVCAFEGRAMKGGVCLGWFQLSTVFLRNHLLHF